MVYFCDYNQKLKALIKSKSLIIVVLILGISTMMHAQEVNSKVNFNAGADFMSRYIWRGAQFGGNAPSVQPALTMSAGNLEIGAWGAFSTAGANIGQEVDLYISYTFNQEMFTATLSDYFFPAEGVDYNYFEYGNDSTGHIFEAALSFNGTDKLPLSLLLAVNFYGADASRINDDPNDPEFNKKDGIQYSTYAELGYSTAVNDVNLDLFMGFNLIAPKKADPNTGYDGESGFYGKNRGLVNLGVTASRELAITDKFSLPIQASLITNPMDKKIYFVFGFSL